MLTSWPYVQTVVFCHLLQALWNLLLLLLLF
jgi:hypothetical protein